MVKRRNIKPSSSRADEFDNFTRAELQRRASQIGIAGRSSMTKEELIKALRRRKSSP